MAGAGPGRRRYVLVSLILAFVGGFADAGSYILVGSFTGHITGNSILLAVHVVNSQWLQALSCLVAVIGFLAGTAGGLSWPHPAGQSACRRLAPVLALEVALIALGTIVPVLPAIGRNNILLASLCLALGLQNGALGKIDSVAFHTTFITGLSTTLVGALATRKPGPQRRLLPPIIGCFVAGALVGAWGATRVGRAAFVLVLTLLALTWLLSITSSSRACLQTTDVSGM